MSLRATVRVRRGDHVVNVAFEVADGETVALVGRNGAGKTTVLEALAGLVPLESGLIELDDRRIDALGPDRRGIGLAFQDGALFPKMSVRENVAFAARARRTPAPKARARADALLAELAPGVNPDARPPQLSGGERQRVALARTLASAPRVLLLDEPLAAVDASARPGLRTMLRDTLAAFPGPSILVTHDPVEAMTLADRLVLLEDGRITQIGTPHDVRNHPATRYAADLVGVNLFEGTLEPTDAGAGRLRTSDGELTVAWPDGLARSMTPVVRATLAPAEITIHAERPEGSSRNAFQGSVVEVAIAGSRARVRLATTPPLVAEVTTGSVERMGLAPGTEVWASCKAVEIRLMVPGFEPDTL
ncbi:MAG: ABC transporter ATP-binding protein [Actinomycetota bacterium]